MCGIAAILSEASASEDANEVLKPTASLNRRISASGFFWLILSFLCLCYSMFILYSASSFFFFLIIGLRGLFYQRRIYCSHLVAFFYIYSCSRF